MFISITLLVLGITKCTSAFSIPSPSLTTNHQWNAVRIHPLPTTTSLPVTIHFRQRTVDERKTPNKISILNFAGRLKDEASVSHSSRFSPLSESSSGASDDVNDDADTSSEEVTESSSSENSKSIPSKLNQWRKGLFKKKQGDELSFSKKLRKMGTSVFLSYGFVSNMSYAVTVSLAWFGFTKKTGLSPLAPGQWKPFLAVYSGFYIFNNIIRPLRLASSVVVSRYFDVAIAYIQRKLKVSKTVAVVTVVFLGNIVGTCTAMSAGIALASAASGVPVFPVKGL